MQSFAKKIQENAFSVVVVCLAFVYACALYSYSSFIGNQKIEQKTKTVQALKSKEKTDKIQQDCIVEALWHEARGESDIGLYAVLSVIVNRKNNPAFPKTFCAVLHQRGQFSYYSPKMQLNPVPKLSEQDRLQLIRTISKDAAEGTFRPILLPNVLWFHSANISTKWSKNLQKDVRIDSHNFYKEK